MPRNLGRPLGFYRGTDPVRTFDTRIRQRPSMNLRRPILMIIFGLSCTTIGAAQEPPGQPDRRSGPPHPEVTVDWSALEQRIAWFGTMKTAKTAAQVTGRPILLVSGQPSCQAVPGVW